MRAVSAEATKLVRAIIAESSGPLSTDEIFKQVLLHRRAIPENAPLRDDRAGGSSAPARPGSVEEFRQMRAQKRADAKQFDKGPVRTKKELQAIVLPTLLSRGVLTKIGASSLPPDELAARFPLTPAPPITPAHSPKHAPHAPKPHKTHFFLWKLRTPAPDAAARSVAEALELGLRPVVPADVGADADWTHLSRRRRRAREAAVQRDVAFMNALQDERKAAAIAALTERREKLNAPPAEEVLGAGF